VFNLPSAINEKKKRLANFRNSNFINMGVSCAKEKPARKGLPANEPEVLGAGIQGRLS